MHNMKKILGLAASLPGIFDMRDVFLFAGLALLAAGLWHVYVPLSFIVPGAVLTYLAVFTNSAG